MNSKVLCVDIGTTSLKAGIISGKGEVISFSAQTISASDEPNTAVQWLPALIRAVREMNAGGFDAVCISGNGPTVVSESGVTILWNSELPEQLKPQLPSTHSLFLPHIAAFIRNYPEEWNRTEYLFSGPEYLIFKLTGKAVTILPEERYREAYWREEDLALFNIPHEKLPPYVPPAFCAGSTLPEITAELGIKEPAPVFCGGPDFITALIGTNTLTPGKICDCAGSSEGINLCTDKPLSIEGIRTLPSIIPGLWNLAVLNQVSGRRFIDHKKSLEKSAGHAISYGEMISNSIEDKNSEGWRIMTEIAANVKNAVEMLRRAAEKYGLPFDEVMTVTGGQAKNAEWMQERARVSGITLAVCNCEDSELTGDAIIAQTGLGNYRTIQEAAAAIVKTTKIYQHNAEPAESMKIYRLPETCSTIIFDIDSTLYTNPAYAFEQVDVQIRFFAEQRGISCAEARSMISNFRRKWTAEHCGQKISLGNTFTHFGVSIDDSINMRNNLLEPAVFLKRDEKLIGTLIKLKEKYKLICVTNNPVLPARKTLEAIGIEKLIPDIIGLDTCRKSKPAREPFLLAAQITDSAPENCLCVGDRYDMDIALPLELGMGGILVTGVSDVYRLPEIL